MPARLDHIVLNVRDVAASVRFYTTFLKFTAERLAEFNAGEVPFPSVRIDEQTVVDLFPAEMRKSDDTGSALGTNLNHFCIAMNEIEWNELRERLTAAGIELHRDKSRNWGARGDGISTYFFDPDGNVVEARYYEAL